MHKSEREAGLSTTYDCVYSQILRQVTILASPELNTAKLEPTSHLIEDVGLDSLKFIDLTVALETAFCIREFPMQEWIDEQIAHDRPLTLGELTRACIALIPSSHNS